MIIFVIIAVVVIPIWLILSGIEKDAQEIAKKSKEKKYVLVEDLERDWELEDDWLTEESFDLTGDLM